jgi:multimeric flavodoxin WrbA
MKIAVLNGSPKGNISITMQYINYIQKKFPVHELKIFNISQRIIKIENDEKSFNEIFDYIKTSDAVIWAFPLYVFLVASQYKRFIELIWERKIENVFENKFAAILTTSIHYFDHTAHNYMHSICDDLNMKFIGGYSAEMMDLEKEDKRENLVKFASNFFESIEKNIYSMKYYRPLSKSEYKYIPGNSVEKIKTEKKVLILTDSKENDSNLINMVKKFKNSFSGEIETINLYDIDIKGGCLGDIRCGRANECNYANSDGFMEFYKTKVMKADIIIFSGAIKDRYLSSKWKQFFDRSFFNTHAPVLIGKQIGFLISGPLSQIPNIAEIMDGYVELQKANNAGFVSDESCSNIEIDESISILAGKIIKFSELSYVKPSTFLGVGGIKIFRDEMYSNLRFPFKADHKYYKKNGVYDFPNRKYKQIFAGIILNMLNNISSFRKEINNKMKSEMIKPLSKIVNRVN